MGIASSSPSYISRHSTLHSVQHIHELEFEHTHFIHSFRIYMHGMARLFDSELAIARHVAATERLKADRQRLFGCEANRRSANF